MINFLKKYWILILVLILAAFLRFYRLDSYPALNADEAAIGYNAYSLIQTGMDEHGHPWPIHFQSFNDYKPGFYFYAVLPFVKFVGLNEWAVRIPNAAFGVFTVLLVYLLVKELFGDNKFAVISAFFLAISPWHIQFSRGGWEVNTATFFITIGLLLFVKALKKPKLPTFVFSVFFFALSLYTYHAARVLVPLLGIGLIAIYRKDAIKNIKFLMVVVLVGLVLLLPLGRDLIKGDVLSRAAGVGLFADKGPVNRINEQRGEHGNINSLAAKLIHNKAVNYGLAFAENWAAHFHGEFLFLTGDAIQRDEVPETGEMYLFDIIFLVVGFIVVSRNLNKEWKLILYWLAVAPVAAALTFQAPHALRAENMVVPLIIVSAYGLTVLINKKLYKWIYVLFALLIAWNFGRYIEMYYNHMSKELPYSSQYGLKELTFYVKENVDKYKDIFVTTRYDQPYILFLFYLKYQPQMFQGHHTLTSRDDFGFSTVADFDKYHFGPIDFASMQADFPNSLIIGTTAEIPKGTNIIQRIYGTNGFEYFDVVAN